jgi:hypothetical protein
LGSCQKGTDLVIFKRKSLDLIMDNDEVRKWWSTPVILYGASHWCKLVSFGIYIDLRFKIHLKMVRQRFRAIRIWSYSGLPLDIGGPKELPKKKDSEAG